MTLNGPGIMNQNQMTKHVTTLSVLASLGLLAACASDSNKAVGSGGATSMGGATGSGGASNTGGSVSTSGGTDAGDDSDAGSICVSNKVFFCANNLSGFPFALDSLTASDYCNSSNDARAQCISGVTPPTGETTANMSQPASGKLCLSGQVSPGGSAVLALEFAQRNPDGTKVLVPFDAAGRGITQVTLTIDSAPSQGLILYAHMMMHRECPASPLDCFYPPNFKYKDVSALGTVIAPLADFKSEDNPSQTIDTSVLYDVFLQVNPGPYNFCVHDFKFLDAQGNEVMDKQQPDGGT